MNDLLVDKHTSTLYYNACPCLSGQHCEGSGQIEVPQGEIGQCQLNVQTKREGVSCSTYKDCAADECCVSNVQPIGKKKRAISFLSGGTCQKLGLSGDSCLVRITTVTDMNLACPCASGLTCKGLGFFEIPLGERGTCT
ncbi:hypothetical protein Btru_019021 [Bulinus truncatus]|nr:hypothetical protein Btru_019021 [Bulinus truncatus]